jgi:hypothetical protein
MLLINLGVFKQKRLSDGLPKIFLSLLNHFGTVNKVNLVNCNLADTFCFKRFPLFSNHKTEN